MEQYIFQYFFKLTKIQHSLYTRCNFGKVLKSIEGYILLENLIYKLSKASLIWWKIQFRCVLISLKHNTYLHPFLGYFWFKPFHILLCFVFCDATYFLVAVSNKSNVISFHNNSVGCLFPYICDLCKIDLFVCARARVYWEGGGSLSSRIDSSLVLTTWTTCIPDTENTKIDFQQ